MSYLGSKLSFGCKALDTIFPGGVPTEAPSGIFSIPNEGKSIMTMQLAVMCTRLGLDALIIDTEKFWLTEVKHNIWTWFKKRWDLKDNDINKIEIVKCPDIFSLGRFFGIEFTVEQEEARVSVFAKYPKRGLDQAKTIPDKVEEEEKTKKSFKKKDKEGDGSSQKRSLQAENWIEYSPVWKKLKEGNYGFLAVDSFTMPVKQVIPGGMQNFSARRTIVTSLSASWFRVAEDFNIPVWSTHHIVKSPQEKYDFGKPWGGSDVEFGVKYWMGLRASQQTFMGNIIVPEHIFKSAIRPRLRLVTRHRYPSYDFDGTSVVLEKDTGYTDMPTTLGGRV